MISTAMRVKGRTRPSERAARPTIDIRAMRCTRRTHAWRRSNTDHSTRSSSWSVISEPMRDLITDQYSRVLDGAQAPISGLYAVGNDISSIMGGNYPGAGITLGPALTFGHIAGCHIAGVRDRAELRDSHDL